MAQRVKGHILTRKYGQLVVTRRQMLKLNIAEQCLT